ncbi:MAG: hypothetical protein ACI360_00860 [Atopobiaceae bacterium]
MAEPTMSAQVNVRMSKDLKRRGDQGLATLGVSSTDAVRRVWELAAAGPAGLNVLSKVFTPQRDERESSARQGLRELHRKYERYMALLGADPSKITVQMPSDEELLTEELMHKYGDGDLS